MGYELSQSLNSVGTESIAVTLSSHVHRYPKQAFLCRSKKKLNRYAAWADLIVFMHSRFLDTGVDLSKKRIAVFNTGTRYRVNSEALNKKFNPLVDVTLTGIDTFGMGAKNEKWLPVPINIDYIQQVGGVALDTEKKVIAHYPSNAKKKGTLGVVDAVSKMRKTYDEFSLKIDTARVSWEENIKRMNNCDIYIERSCLNSDGIVTGSYGTTALEAAALGKIVITKFIYHKEFQERFGCRFGLVGVETQNELAQQLENLISLPKKKIAGIKQRIEAWLRKIHSHTSVGKRLKEIFEEI